MVEDIKALEFTLTRSMTYTLMQLSDLIKRRNELLNSCDSSYETSKAIMALNVEIAKLKEEFVSEFRLENKEQIENYWYLRSRE